MDRQHASSTSATAGDQASRGSPRALRLPRAELDDLSRIRAFVSRGARLMGADEMSSADLVQAVDESATNVLVHGYHGAPGPLDIVIERRDDSVVVLVRDRAPLFDPTRWPEPDLDRPLDQRPLGGLGIHLARGCVDRMEHTMMDPTGNQLTLVRGTGTPAKESRP